MPLHIIQQAQSQEVPDWRWQLAASFLMPLITDAIQGQRQRDVNRKQNAAIGEILRQAGELGGTTQHGGLQGLSEPEGYNTDGWAQAFHQQNNPLAQMDAGLLPPSGKQSIPTQAEMQRIIGQVLATPRFSMVDPKVIQEYLAPMLQANEAARQEGFRDNAGEAYANAPDALGQRNAVMEAVIRGHLPESLGTMMQGQYTADRPQNMSRDLGGTLQDGYVDPTTGTFTPTGTTPKTLTPQQEQAGQQWQQTFGETVRTNRVNEDYRDRQLRQQGEQFDARLGYERETRDLQREDAGLSVVDKSQIDYLSSRRKELNDQYIALTKALGAAQTDQQRADILQDMQKAKRDIAAIDTKIRGIYEGKFTDRGRAQEGSLGTAMLENANAGRISNNGYFGHDRKDHAHAGTDYPAEEGTPIKVQPDMGKELTVVDVNTNPGASTYGNYVVLEGMKNGHKVRYRMAHMKTGSIVLKKGDVVKSGDIIGSVGSTGRSSGPHLHLEVSVNGQRIDPETFSQVFASPAYQSSKDIPPVAEKKQDQPEQTPAPVAQTTTDAQQYIKQHPEANLSPSYQSINMSPALTSPQEILPEQAQVAQTQIPSAPVEEIGTTFMGEQLPGLPTATQSSTDEATAMLPPLASVADEMKYYANQPLPEMTDDMELAASRRPALRRPAARSTRGRTSYEALRGTIDGAAQRHGIDNELIRAIIEVESAWNPNARSHVGAQGLMQLMPATARSLGVRNAYDPAQNVDGGTRYISQLIRKYGGDVSKALMAYNCGPGNVARGRIPQSSRAYAQKVMGIYNRLKGQRGSKPAPVQPQTAPDGGSISWLNSSGEPAVRGDGRPFTDESYNSWVNAVNAGEYRDVGLNSQADLDRWLESRGMRRARPAEEQGLTRLNSNRGSVADVYDASIAPEPQTPQNSPTLYPAPYFTEEINGTRAQDTQAMLDALNGVARGDGDGWSAAFHRLFGR